jgi:hypothetical protein
MSLQDTNRLGFTSRREGVRVCRILRTVRVSVDGMAFAALGRLGPPEEMQCWVYFSLGREGQKAGARL